MRKAQLSYPPYILNHQEVLQELQTKLEKCL